jgi:hypothetical protein
LEVNAILDEPDIETVNRLTGLRTLKIVPLYDYSSPAVNISTPLSLSELRNLHVLKPSSSIARIEYKLPALQDLFLADQSARYLPDIQPAHIHRELPWASGVKLLPGAEKILTKYPGAKRITTNAHAKGAVLDAITRLKRAGKLSAEFHTLVFENASGVADEIICVEDI